MLRPRRHGSKFWTLYGNFALHNVIADGPRFAIKNSVIRPLRARLNIVDPRSAHESRVRCDPEDSSRSHHLCWEWSAPHWLRDCLHSSRGSGFIMGRALRNQGRVGLT